MLSAIELASLAETFRAREVYRYYQPTSSTAPNFQASQAFSDTALTAFAQLIALRLGTERAIVSLSDHENEYFLAESTSTLILLDAKNHAQNQKLSISGARVPRAESLCEQTLECKPDLSLDKFPVVTVPDLSLDKKLMGLDCVTGEPSLRFYCGVALTNNRGINIGAVYAVDSTPRKSITPEQAEFLTMMAATVMDHLENIRAKEEVTRVTQMSQGLHAFIEGAGTMAGDWARLKKYNLPSGAGVGFSWGSTRTNVEPDATEVPPTIMRTIPSTKVSFSGNDEGFTGIVSPLSETQNEARQFNFNNSPWNSASEVPLNSVFHVLQSNREIGIAAPGVLLAEANYTQKTTQGKSYSNDGFATLLHNTFSRASNLIREGMEVDGAVFFDAPVGFYQSRSNLENDPRLFEDIASDSSSEEDAEELANLSLRPGPTPQVHTSNRSRSLKQKKSPATGIISGLPSLKSDILGFSTEHISSLNGDEADSSDAFAAIDQSLLTALVRRYPQGELFVFNANGPISPPKEAVVPGAPRISAAVEAKRDRHRSRKRAEILRLLVAFPGARQIFFVPLYDSISGCFIGSFAWSTSKTRIFSTENDLSYLIAFGHSVMAEVSRLNTLSADRAKGDFISNVSHELRSPLHGILASAEFLADTSLDGFQRSLVETVDICGRTLLDTIEHVLDFSKIKKFGQKIIQPMGVVTDLDISTIIEEVLEGVYAGFEFNGLSSEGLSDTTKSKSQEAITTQKLVSSELKIALANEVLTIILDIDFRDQWKFPTVPGTWRRLTTNLFGNALKNTPRGWIKVKLEAQAVPRTINGPETMVILTITDTGKGMSKEFMKTKLFMPFSQEDVTMPGTGLGMSMVKEIVDLSGGMIDVQSEPGKGTEIRLSMRLENCSAIATNVPEVPEAEDEILTLRRRAKGRTVTIRGFDSSTGKDDIQSQGIAILKASIVNYVTEWFHLTLVPSSSANSTTADIIISDESVFLDSATTSGKALLNEGKSLLILCSNGARRGIYASRIDIDHVIEFVSKPCGPHRLAKGLLNCLDKEEVFVAKHSLLTVQDLDLSYAKYRDTAIRTEYERVSIVESAVLKLRNRADIEGSHRVIADIPISIELSSSASDLNRSRDHNGTRSSSSDSRARRASPGAALDDHISSQSSNRSMTVSPGIMSESPPLLEAEIEEERVAVPASVSELPVKDQYPVIRRPKMLLVEDNPVNMMLLATYMRKNNWDFEMGENGLLALEAVRARPEGFDVIFMDVSMPVMTGYEATTAIRKVESQRRAAGDDFQPALIIALTGFSSETDQEEAFEAGVDIFMTKPVRFREVGRVLEGWKRSAFPDDPDIR